MIKFGIRQSFDRMEQVEERYVGVGVPVEVALPYYWAIYEPVRGHLTEIATKIRSYGTEVLSVHAVQAPISAEKFKEWGAEIARFSLSLGVTAITIHPNNVNERKKIDAQKRARENLQYLSSLYNGR